VLALSVGAHFCAAVFLAWLANWLGLRRWRHTRGAHWTERARLLWPARITALLNIFVIPFLLVEAHKALGLASAESWGANAFAGFLGVLLAGYAMDQETYPNLCFRTWFHQASAVWALQLGSLLVLITGGALMPAEPGWKMAAIVVLYLVLHLSLQFGLLIQYFRLLKFVRPAGERLQRIIDETASRDSVHVRATWQMGGVHAQALAFPTTREMMFTDRLLEICSDHELAAICQHELAHLKESRIVLLGRLAGSFRLFGFLFFTPLIRWLGAGGLLVPFLWFMTVSKFSNMLSQRMEKRADTDATRSQAAAGVYAQALEKLYESNQVPAVLRGKARTHPHLYDRLLAAGVTPDYERPRPPGRITAPGLVYTTILVVLFSSGVFRQPAEPWMPNPAEPGPELPSQTAPAVPDEGPGSRD
jgi:Zn-dependent protease with chaperone function